MDYNFDSMMSQAEQDTSEMRHMAYLLLRGADALNEIESLKEEAKYWRELYMKDMDKGLKEAKEMTSLVIQAILKPMIDKE